MPILIKLFLTFLKIGAVSFGGGYAMIPLVREEVLLNGWLSEDAFINFIAVAESTPGPIAINMATFIGASQAGILGSLFATLGVVLPSFIIILIIASLIKNFIHYKGVQSLLKGIKPVIAGLITATAITMILSSILALKTINSSIEIDYKAIIILALIIATTLIYKKLLNKKPSAIVIIIFSAILGMILYSF